MRPPKTVFCVILAGALLTACAGKQPAADRFAPHGAALKRHNAAIERIGQLGGKVIPERPWAALGVFDSDPATTAAILAAAEDLLDLGSISLFGSQPPAGWVARFHGQKHLAHLAISNARLAPQDLAAMSGLPALEALDLINVGLTDADLGAMVDAAPHLKRLTLAQAEVTDAGAITLGQLKDLRYLRLVETSISGGGLTRLLMRNPWLVVDYGNDDEVIAGAWSGQ